MMAIAAGSIVRVLRRGGIAYVVHRRDPFDGAARRIMHRTQIKGRHRPQAIE